MSSKQIILLVTLAVADLCVLSVGLALLLFNNPQVASSPAGSAALQATASAPVSPTLQASATLTSPPSPSPKPTETRWPTWTPRPSETPFPTMTPLPSPTPTITPTPKPSPTKTSQPAAIAPTQRAGGAPPGSGGAPGAPGKRVGCGTPNGQPTNGKLDVFWHVIVWQDIPGTGNAKGTMEVIPSGGNDCYKYNFMGVNYDYEPFDFVVRQCAGTPVSLIVTSRDGQTWKQDFIISAGADEGFKCK